MYLVVGTGFQNGIDVGFVRVIGPHLHDGGLLKTVFHFRKDGMQRQVDETNVGDFRDRGSVGIRET